MNELEKRVHEFALANGYAQIQKADDWHGFEVYEPVYFEPTFVGLPFVILVKGNSIRLSTVEETFERLDELPD